MSILAIDIGGTKTAVGVFEKGCIKSSIRIQACSFSSPPDYLNGIIDAGKKAIAESNVKSIVGIGIGCGGPLDRKTGKILVVPNLPGWDNLPLVSIFSDTFNAPAYLDNDQTVACLGELVYGAGKGFKNFVYLGVSTGIGGGIVIDGKVYRGSNDNAGEFGHHKILENGPQCPCGDKGCLEALASGTSIARMAREFISKLPLAERPIWAQNSASITSEMVAKKAAEGDKLASVIWRESMRYLGIGVSNIISIFNPELVILGGGVTKAGELLFEPVRSTVSQRTLPALLQNVQIVASALGDNAGLIGAAALVLEQSGELFD